MQDLINQDVIAKLLESNTKSSIIRYLNAKMYARSKIAKMLNIRYQHVKNVLDVRCTMIDIDDECKIIEAKITALTISDTTDIEDPNQLDLFGKM